MRREPLSPPLETKRVRVRKTKSTNKNLPAPETPEEYDGVLLGEVPPVVKESESN